MIRYVVVAGDPPGMIVTGKTCDRHGFVGHYLAGQQRNDRGGRVVHRWLCERCHRPQPGRAFARRRVDADERRVIRLSRPAV